MMIPKIGCTHGVRSTHCMCYAHTWHMRKLWELIIHWEVHLCVDSAPVRMIFPEIKCFILETNDWNLTCNNIDEKKKGDDYGDFHVFIQDYSQDRILMAGESCLVQQAVSQLYTTLSSIHTPTWLTTKPHRENISKSLLRAAFPTCWGLLVFLLQVLRHFFLQLSGVWWSGVELPTV